MKIENLKKLKSTNPIVQNAIAHCVAKNEGTSEGAKKGWETRKAGGAGGAEDDWDSMSETDRAIAERTAAKYGGTPHPVTKHQYGQQIVDGLKDEWEKSGVSKYLGGQSLESFVDESLKEAKADGYKASPDDISWIRSRIVVIRLIL